MSRESLNQAASPSPKAFAPNPQVHSTRSSRPPWTLRQ